MTERLTRAQQQARTREKLLDSAEALFGEQGIHQTSLDQIAAAAGLTKGAIYANFGGKKDLIVAIMQRRLDDDEPGWARMSADSFVGARGDSYEKNMALPETRRFAMAFTELWLHGMRHEDDGETLRRWLRTIRESHARDARDVGMAQPETVAALMVALDVGIALQNLVDPEGVPATGYRSGVEAVVRAFTPREAQPPR
ncbi:TetR/AcrR family transcriptional regulator [Actinoplanes sp. RD1]|uniref:TetR/AcrR family transcriptional regulator n=1 Tax=Actinoplanes sp. RD1 TaxID=3064538 RepID=UPI002740F573|nr:TetR family transcriptional regulator [Actinoplanes sp. RD1]